MMHVCTMSSAIQMSCCFVASMLIQHCSRLRQLYLCDTLLSKANRMRLGNSLISAIHLGQWHNSLHQTEVYVKGQQQTIRILSF